MNKDNDTGGAGNGPTLDFKSGGGGTESPRFNGPSSGDDLHTTNSTSGSTTRIEGPVEKTNRCEKEAEEDKIEFEVVTGVFEGLIDEATEIEPVLLPLDALVHVLNIVASQQIWKSSYDRCYFRSEDTLRVRRP
jgi:hypothetical protein